MKMEQSVPKRRHIKLRRRGELPRRKHKRFRNFQIILRPAVGTIISFCQTSSLIYLPLEKEEEEEIKRRYGGEMRRRGDGGGGEWRGQ
jgi:hypothetical protein